MDTLFSDALRDLLADQCTPQVVRDAYQHLFSLYEQGKLKPHVMAAYPMADYAQAMHMVQDRKVLGKVVITMRV